jgi:hypothetical protein
VVTFLDSVIMSLNSGLGYMYLSRYSQNSWKLILLWKWWIFKVQLNYLWDTACWLPVDLLMSWGSAMAKGCLNIYKCMFTKIQQASYIIRRKMPDLWHSPSGLPGCTWFCRIDWCVDSISVCVLRDRNFRKVRQKVDFAWGFGRHFAIVSRCWNLPINYCDHFRADRVFTRRQCACR